MTNLTSLASHAPTYAEIAKPHPTAITIQIQDKEEATQVKNLSAEEIIQKIGQRGIIGARNGSNGTVHLYTNSATDKTMLESHKDWTTKLASSAKVSGPNFQVLVHNMPRSFLAGTDAGNKALQAAQVGLPRLQITRTAWLNKNWMERKTNKQHSAVLVWTSTH